LAAGGNQSLEATCGLRDWRADSPPQAGGLPYFAALVIAGIALALPVLARSEIIDRIAVAFERKVITESAIRDHIRVTAFLNEEAVSFSPASRRRAADQLLEQALIRREMEISRYPAPVDAEIPATLEHFRKQHYPSPAVFQKKLEEYGIDEKQLGRALLDQVTILRFIELRFRPGVAVGDGEIEIYYREQFVPQWEKQHSGKPIPDLEEVRDRIEQTLAAESVDRALDQWLREARNQARVRYFEEAFR
jgi:hypothetical protein